MKSRAPEPVRALARARVEARERRDWAEADRLRAEIDAAGWKVIDDGLSFRLAPAHAPDVEVEGRMRYGRSSSVPSRLDEPPVGQATVVLVATEPLDMVARAIAGIRRHAPEATQLIVVGDTPGSDVEAELERLTAPSADAEPPELILLSEPLGAVAAANAGIRRAACPVVVLLDATAEPLGDFVTPLVRTLDDPAVAVAGAWGLRSDDMRHFVEGGPGEVDAIDEGCLAFRRADYIARGPLDERFHLVRGLATWWSLALRDDGEDRPARRAVVVEGLPLARHEAPSDDARVGGAPDRRAKRDAYRILDRFGRRRDLFVATRGERP